MSNFLSYTNYLSLEKKYSKHTVLAYTKDLVSFSDFCFDCFDGIDVDLCNYSHIRSWVVSLLEAGVVNRSVNRKLASLKSYYSFLLLVGEIDVNPLLKHKSLKVVKKLQIPFSVAEMDFVLASDYSDDSFEGIRNRFMVEMFYATGIRKAELISLRISDIDLNSRTIKVLGKRNKERVIPMSSSLLVGLESYMQAREALFVSVEIDNLFLTKKGTIIYNSLVYRVINSYFSIASTKLKKSPHVLRHTFATHLLNEGADLNSIKELLGHTSLAATQIYVHNSMAKLKDVYKNTHPRSKKT